MDRRSTAEQFVDSRVYVSQLTVDPPCSEAEKSVALSLFKYKGASSRRDSGSKHNTFSGSSKFYLKRIVPKIHITETLNELCFMVR